MEEDEKEEKEKLRREGKWRKMKKVKIEWDIKIKRFYGGNISFEERRKKDGC